MVLALSGCCFFFVPAGVSALAKKYPEISQNEVILKGTPPTPQNNAVSLSYGPELIRMPTPISAHFSLIFLWKQVREPKYEC